MSNGDISAEERESEASEEAERIAEAKELARKHYEIEEGLTDVFLLTDTVSVTVQRPRSIKLLEVNQNTVASGIVPIKFLAAPSSGVNFPSVIVEVTPEEFRKIQSHELKLPDGWAVGEWIPPPTMVDE